MYYLDLTVDDKTGVNTPRVCWLNPADTFAHTDYQEEFLNRLFDYRAKAYSMIYCGKSCTLGRHGSPATLHRDCFIDKTSPE